MASCSTGPSTPTLRIGDTPHQPSNISFPSRTFGKKTPVQRSFQASWYKKWEWLHYDISRDCVLCFICCKAVKDGKVRVSKLAEGSFLTDGFTNWKDATTKFTKHEHSDFHKHCSEVLSTSCVDVGDLLDKQAASEKKANREYLLKVLSTVRFLARQGLPLLGSGDEIDSSCYYCVLMIFHLLQTTLRGNN